MIVRNWINSKLNRFSDDSSGVVSVEFAFITPFLLLLWLGSISLIDIENATTEVGKVTSTVADILAQAPELNENTVDNAFKASKALIGKDRQGDLEMYVAGIRITKNDPNNPNEVGSTQVVWSRGSNLKTLTLPSMGNSYNLPMGLRMNEGFIVTTHGKLEHVPLYASEYSAASKVEYEYQNYFTPRNSLETECTSC